MPHSSQPRPSSAADVSTDRIFTLSPDPLCVAGPDGQLKRVNPAFERTLGRTEEALLARPFIELVHPDDRAATEDVWGRILAGAGIELHENRWLCADGSYRWLSWRVSRPDADRLVYGVARDVTDRRRVEAALEASEARYRTLVETAYEGVWAVDAVGATTYVNPRLCHMLGYDAAELLGRQIFDFMPPEAAFEARTLFARQQRGIADVHDLTFRRRDGAELYAIVASSPLADERGEFAGALAMVTDVTELRRAAQRLEESEQRYRSLFQNHPDAVISFDLEGRFVSANPAAETISGYRRDDLLGQQFGPLVVPEHREAVAAHVRDAAAGVAQSCELDILHAAGHRVQLGFTKIPIIVAGRVVGVYGIARDLTAQRALEAQFRQAQKMEAVGRLAGGIAHDFNNLLSVIASYSGMVLSELPDEDPARADLLEIQRAVDRAAGLTRQLLAFSRQQVLQPRVLDLCDVVEGTQRMLQRLIGEDIVLVTRTERRPALVKADPGQLEQVLMNLAVNARDAMPSGGTLTIAVEGALVEGDAAQRLTNGMPGRYVHLRVTDTGHGMDEATQAQIFEPFFTTKKLGHGTGLGLATVYGIVKQSGGFIWVDSAPTAGTTFTILLPLATEAVEQPAGEAPRGAGAHARGATLLLVEDEPALRAAARRLLEKQGYTVLTAANGAEALELVERDTGPVHLVVSDVVMPHMSGQELVSRLEPRLGDVPVLFMSGYAIEAVERHGVLRPGALFLKKPFKPHEFLLAVAEALAAGRARS